MIKIRGLLPLAIALLFSASAVKAQDRLLTIDDIYDPQKKINFAGASAQFTWLNDGVHYLRNNSDPNKGPVGLVKVEASTGKSELFVDSEKMQKALAAVGINAEDAAKISKSPAFTLNSAQTAALINHSNDLYIYELNEGRAARLTNSPDPESDEAFSPDGKSVAFVRNNNIYVVDIASQKESALTANGNRELLNGRLDWVYEEEVYGRGVTRSYWWSPDSQQIAYLTIDETGVPDFTVIDDLPQGQKLEIYRYPKSGDPNPKVKLSVVSAAGGESKAVDLSYYQGGEFLIVRVGWTPDGKQVAFEVQDRVQTWLDLNLADPKTGAVRKLFREESKAWVDASELPEWIADGSFIWTSDRTGWKHLYHYSADGKLIKPVTAGEWDVRELYGVADDGWVYFSASEHSPIADDVYRVKADGSGFTRLSRTEGNHKAIFNPLLASYIDVWSNITTPPQIRLHKSDGAEVLLIEESKIPALAEFKFGKSEFLKVKTRDGFTMEAMMIKPPDFDQNKKYPVMIYNYSGPASPSVRNVWGGRVSGGVASQMWHQMLAQRGYIIWICDNRSASQKGMQSAQPVFHNLGELELRDMEDSIAWLKSQAYIDGSRIGLWGWSYGGYMTAFALTHSTSFKVGVCGAPVTDWRNYDTIYTERYMGRPQDNPEGYKKSSVLEAAKNLHGKFLLIHGAIDDNVHLQNSIQLVDALQKAGKHFDLMLYPRARHGVVNPLQVKHLREMMIQFILENL